MKLKGLLDFSLGNFLCLRGFAPLGVLQDISSPDENIQRIPKGERLKDVGNFLKNGEFLFFPEVVLCVELDTEKIESDSVSTFFGKVSKGEAFRTTQFAHGLRISSTVSRSKKLEDLRAVQFFQVGTIEFDVGEKTAFSRIDGNHRLAATKSTDTQVRDRTTPFCIVFCRNSTEFKRFSRALFHNINYKQVPLPKEHNLRLILDDPDLFPDDRLQLDPSFGWPYYLARQLHIQLDFDILHNLKPFIEKTPRSFLVDQFSFLIEKKLMGNNEKAIKLFKITLGKTDGLFDRYPPLKESKNIGLLAALTYYQMQPQSMVDSFIRWVLENHLHLIVESNTSDLIQIFDKVLESRKRTIFVSMPFGEATTENHYEIIERVCKEVNVAYTLNPGIKVQRVDWFQDGTSYEINDKIIEMMSDCGMLIGNLTCCNPNVYHEIGFVMGKAKAEGKDTADMLLFLDESVADIKDKFVGFNLAGIKQLRFTRSEKFAEALRENIEKFYKL